MTEATENTAVDAADAAAAADLPVSDAATQPASIEPTPAPPPPEADAADTPPKNDKVERRIANLTRKMADEARLREAAERRAAAAEALLHEGRPDKAPPTQQPTADVEARASQIVAEREFNRRLTEIDQAGAREIGADAWERAKATMTGLGAVNNQAFLQALAEAENPAKLFAHFADDTDALMDILNKSPAAMAAKVGRMDAEMAKPAARPLSSAPPPAPKVVGSGVAPSPDIYNYPANMSMKEWVKMADQYLPDHLGGKKKPA